MCGNQQPGEPVRKHRPPIDAGRLRVFWTLLAYE
jgi:hypothetical protein